VAYVINKVCSSNQWSCIAVPYLPGCCYLWSHTLLVHWLRIFYFLSNLVTCLSTCKQWPLIPPHYIISNSNKQSWPKSSESLHWSCAAGLCRPSNNHLCGWVGVVACWAVNWIPTEHGQWCSWSVVEMTGCRHDVACQEFKLPDSWLFSTLYSVLMKHYNFDHVNWLCIFQGTAVLFFRCSGKINNGLCQIACGFDVSNVVKIRPFLMEY